MRILSAALYCLLLMSSLVHAQSARLQPERIYEGDIAILLLEYENRIPSLYALDTSPLERNFEVLDVKARTSRVTVSEQYTNRMQWQVQILPLRIGLLDIPSLSLGSLQTPELSLEVLPAPAAGRGKQRVFVHMDAEPLQPYVGQQVRILSQLHHNTSVIGGYWSEPEAEGAEVYRGGNERNFTRSHEGDQFNVSERRFVLFAGSSDEFEIPAVHYRGQIPTVATETELDPYAGTPLRRIYRRSESVLLKPRPIPAAYQGRYWLPARQLEITQRWGLIEDLEVGDTLDRVLTISARGLAAAALPQDLLATAGPQFTLYADRPERSNRYDGENLIGSLEQSFALILTRPGEVEIPALRLQWWDVDADSASEFVLPGRVVTVAKASVGSDLRQLNFQKGRDPDRSTARQSLPLWLLLPLCAAFVVYSVYARRLAEVLKAVAQRHRLRRRLRSACEAGDAPAARRALIDWGAQHWPGRRINSLSDIRHCCVSDGLQTELRRLDAAIYSGHSMAWQGRVLWRAIVDEISSRPNRSQTDGLRLPAIYPRG